MAAGDTEEDAAVVEATGGGTAGIASASVDNGRSAACVASASDALPWERPGEDDISDGGTQDNKGRGIVGFASAAIGNRRVIFADAAAGGAVKAVRGDATKAAGAGALGASGAAAAHIDAKTCIAIADASPNCLILAAVSEENAPTGGEATPLPVEVVLAMLPLHAELVVLRMGIICKKPSIFIN